MQVSQNIERSSHNHAAVLQQEPKLTDQVFLNCYYLSEKMKHEISKEKQSLKGNFGQEILLVKLIPGYKKKQKMKKKKPKKNERK